MHGISHFKYAGHIYFCAVLNKDPALFILLDLKLVLGRVEQVHNLFVVDFNVGTLYCELKGLIESLYFLEESLHHPRYEAFQLWIIMTRTLSKHPNSTYIVHVLPPPVWPYANTVPLNPVNTAASN
jgi:hypothetical protein